MTAKAAGGHKLLLRRLTGELFRESDLFYKPFGNGRRIFFVPPKLKQLYLIPDLNNAADPMDTDVTWKKIWQSYLMVSNYSVPMASEF